MADSRSSHERFRAGRHPHHHWSSIGCVRRLYAGLADPNGCGRCRFTAGGSDGACGHPIVIKATSTDGSLIRQAAFETVVPR